MLGFVEIRLSHVEKKVPNVNQMHTFAPVNIIPACCSSQIFQHIFKILRHFKTGCRDSVTPNPLPATIINILLSRKV